MSGRTYDRLTSAGVRLSAALDQIKDLEVFVGFQAGDDSYENGVDIANVAAFNELGTSRAPSRPFLRMSIDDNADRVDAMCQEAVGAIVDNGDAETALKKLGVTAVGLVQEEIVEGAFVPNAESTIARKGSSKPLIDTGQMRQSVHYVVQKKGTA